MLSPDSRRLATFNADGLLRVWRLMAPRPRAKPLTSAECLRWVKHSTPSSAAAGASGLASSGHELVVAVNEHITLMDDNRGWWLHDGAPDPSEVWTTVLAEQLRGPSKRVLSLASFRS